jgi:hypothetical protein
MSDQGMRAWRDGYVSCFAAKHPSKIRSAGAQSNLRYVWCFAAKHPGDRRGAGRAGATPAAPHRRAPPRPRMVVAGSREFGPERGRRCINGSTPVRKRGAAPPGAIGPFPRRGRQKTRSVPSTPLVFILFYASPRLLPAPPVFFVRFTRHRPGRPVVFVRPTPASATHGPTRRPRDHRWWPLRRYRASMLVLARPAIPGTTPIAALVVALFVTRFSLSSSLSLSSPATVPAASTLRSLVGPILSMPGARAPRPVAGLDPLVGTAR